ncbi:hypothetical protein PM082_002052 [Marasmius tenuissimus]|nr:hypothetical protein PM082_002052 [Marasmius tenuissimus]
MSSAPSKIVRSLPSLPRKTHSVHRLSEEDEEDEVRILKGKGRIRVYIKLEGPLRCWLPQRMPYTSERRVFGKRGEPPKLVPVKERMLL